MSGAGIRFFVNWTWQSMRRSVSFKRRFKAKWILEITKAFAGLPLLTQSSPLVPPPLPILISHPDLECGGWSFNGMLEVECMLVELNHEYLVRIMSFSVTYFGKYQLLIYTGLSPRSSIRSIVRTKSVFFTHFFLCPVLFSRLSLNCTWIIYTCFSLPSNP